jgi:SAM-dependent methyltransferase
MIRRIAWSLYGRYAWDQNQNHQVTESVRARILAALDESRRSAGAFVLDAGCGTGYYAAGIRDAGYRVLGVDYAGGMINKARAKFGNLDSLRFEKADLSRALPYPDSTFDHIVSVSVLQSVPDPVFTLREFRRILKPEGTIVITHTPRPDGQQVAVDQDGGGRPGSVVKRSRISGILLRAKSAAERKGFSSYWTLGELKAILARGGLTVSKTEFVCSIIILTARSGSE